MQAELDKNPNTLFTSYHPVWGLQDISFVTSRRVMDKLTSINVSCVTDGVEEWLVPEQFLICWLRSMDVQVHYAAWAEPNRHSPQDFERAADWEKAWEGTCLKGEWKGTRGEQFRYDSELVSLEPQQDRFRTGQLKCDSSCHGAPA